jgi:hypothetical protein
MVEVNPDAANKSYENACHTISSFSEILKSVMQCCLHHGLTQTQRILTANELQE